MPPATHVTMRRRTEGLFTTCVSELKLLRWVLGEFGLECANVLIAVGQLVACWGFYPEYPDLYKGACITFFVTSVISMFIVAHSIHEANEFHSLNDVEEGKHQREVAELALYFLASTLFAVGSVLFLPEVTKYNERTKVHAGTWCFFLGSAQLALATFVNSLSVAEVGTWGHQSLKNKLGILTLLFAQVGSCLFLIGTPCFFPQLESSRTEWNIIRFGTNMYLAGCIAYLFGACLNVALAYLKHAEHKKKTAKFKLGRSYTATGSAMLRSEHENGDLSA